MEACTKRERVYAPRQSPLTHTYTNDDNELHSECLLKGHPTENAEGMDFKCFLLVFKIEVVIMSNLQVIPSLPRALPASYLTSHFTSLDVYFIKPELIIHMSHI